MITKDIDFNWIVETALSKANDKNELKKFLARQMNIAERNNYITLDEFSSSINVIVDVKLKYIEYIHEKYLIGLQDNIDNIDSLSFKFHPSKEEHIKELVSSQEKYIKDFDLSKEEQKSKYLKQIRDIQKEILDTRKEKYIEWAMNEIKHSKLKDYNKNEYGRLKNIIKVINSFSGIKN